MLTSFILANGPALCLGTLTGAAAVLRRISASLPSGGARDLYAALSADATLGAIALTGGCGLVQMLVTGGVI